MEVVDAHASNAAERKKIKDKGRRRPGHRHKKRLHILYDDKQKAFNGWEDVQNTWTYQMCENYIEWCHISKLFSFSRHTPHRKSDKANLHHCKHPKFKERCIEVWQHLYGKAKVKRNEVNLSIARMVYAEEILGKSVDWKSLNYTGSKMIPPNTNDIPRGRLFRTGGLGKKMDMDVGADDEVLWSSTSSDDEHTGCSPHTRRNIEKGIKGNWLENALFDMLGNDTLDTNIGSLPISNVISREDVYIPVESSQSIGGPPSEDVVPTTIVSSDLQQRISCLETELINRNNEVVEYKKRIEVLETLLQEKDAEIVLLKSTSMVDKSNV